MGRSQQETPAKGDTRQLILRRAIEVVEQNGEQAIRVNDIARDCGVQITSLYHFFGNREGLLEAVQAARYSDYAYRELDAFDQMIHRCSTRAEFRQMLSEGVEFLFTGEERIRLRMRRLEILGSAATRPRLAAELARQQIADSRRMAEVFGYAQENGWVNADVDLVAYSAFFIGVMNARAMIELREGDFDGSAWNELASRALLSIIPPG